MKKAIINKYHRKGCPQDYIGMRADGTAYVIGHFVKRGENGKLYVGGYRKSEEVKPGTIGCFTRMRSKKGEKIYEGDWVSLGPEHLWRILWGNDEFVLANERDGKWVGSHLDPVYFEKNLFELHREDLPLQDLREIKD
jgi:hypothetical protein